MIVFVPSGPECAKTMQCKEVAGQISITPNTSVVFLEKKCPTVSSTVQSTGFVQHTLTYMHWPNKRANIH